MPHVNKGILTSGIIPPTVLVALATLAGFAFIAALAEQAWAAGPAFSSSALESDTESNYVQITLQANQDAIRPGDGLVLAVSFHFLKPDLHVYGNDNNASMGTPTEVKPLTDPAGRQFGRPIYPPSRAVVDGGFKLTEYDQDFAVFIPGTVPAILTGNKADFSVQVIYQVCGQASCFEGKTITVNLSLPVRPAGAAVQPANAAVFANFHSPVFANQSATTQPEARLPQSQPADAGAGIGAGSTSGPAKIWDFEPSQTHWALSLLISLLVGLALNVTPCVLPIIPLTVGYFVHQSQEGGSSGDRRQNILLSGTAFTAGMVGTFLVLGAVVVLAGSRFGLVFEYPLAKLGLGLFIVIMALGMFEMYPVMLPNFVGRLAGGRSGLSGAFLMGALAAVMSTPCTGPWLGAMIVYALKAPAILGLASFAGVGLGMALPYLVLTAAPGLLDSVPRSGRWTELVKVALGFLLLGMALSVFNGLRSDPQRWQFAIWASVVLAATIWACASVIRSRTEARWVWPVRLAVLTIVVAALGSQWPAESMVVISQGDAASGRPIPGQTHELAGVQWYDYDPGLLERARLAKLPVLLDLVSDNCHYCDVMENQVWSKPPSGQALKGIIAVRVNTSRSEGQPLLKQFNVNGTPGLVFLDREGKTVRVFSPVPETLYDPAGFIEAARPIRQTLGLP